MTYLPRAIVEPAAVQRTARFENLLPPVLSVAAFECRLGGGSHTVDYSMSVHARPDTRHLLCDIDREPGTVYSPAWDGIRRRLGRWARSSAFFQIPMIWIEVDASEEAERDRPFLVYTLIENCDEDDEARLRATCELAAMALEIEDDHESLAGLEVLLRRLPQWCPLGHVALRPTEDGHILRAICRMPSTRAPDFAAGGRGSPAGRAIDAITGKVFGHSTVINVNLDVMPEVGPRVGVEFYFVGAPDEDHRWHILFDALESLGLLTGEKRDAITRWPSRRLERDPATAPLDTIVRDLLIKIDFDDTGPRQAKAYLPFAPLHVLS